MTAKEKAIELVETFWTEVEDNDYQTRKMSFKQAKQCALIAVDELIESHLVLTTTHDLKPSIRCKRYWQEVKQELLTFKSE